MKNLITIVTLLSAISAAHATQPEKPGNGNAPTNYDISPSAAAGAAAVAGAAAGAIAGSQSASTAAGGSSTAAGGAGGSSSASVSGGGDDNNVYVAPAPVSVPALPSVPCGTASAKNKSFGFVWNLISVAEGSTDTSDCTLIQMRNAKADACQYASAKQIEDMLIAKHLPAFVPSPNTMRDYSVEECKAAAK